MRAFAAADYTWQFRQHPGGSALRKNLRFGMAGGAGCAVLTASSLIVPQASAAPITLICGQYQYMPVTNKLGESFIIRNDNYGGQRECISNSNAWPNFAVTQSSASSKSGPVMAFPYIFLGCSWGLCTPGSGLPARVPALHDPLTSWNTSLPGGGIWDATYDIWFNKTRIITGQATGGELMIWINSHGQPAPRANTPIVWEDHARWYLKSWITQHAGIKWRLIQFRRVRPVSQVANLQLNAFIDQAEAHHWIRPLSWMLNIEAGFEIWSDGSGLTTNWFAARA
jgi:hypothetical protein